MSEVATGLARRRACRTDTTNLRVFIVGCQTVSDRVAAVAQGNTASVATRPSRVVFAANRAADLVFTTRAVGGPVAVPDFADARAVAACKLGTIVAAFGFGGTACLVFLKRTVGVSITQFDRANTRAIRAAQLISATLGGAAHRFVFTTWAVLATVATQICRNARTVAALILTWTAARRPTTAEFVLTTRALLLAVAQRTPAYATTAAALKLVTIALARTTLLVRTVGAVFKSVAARVARHAQTVIAGELESRTFTFELWTAIVLTEPSVSAGAQFIGSEDAAGTTERTNREENGAGRTHNRLLCTSSTRPKFLILCQP